MERNLRWKKLKSEYVYKDRWFIARADSCELPDGRVIEPYYVVELPDWTNVIVLTKDERMVFVKQYRYPVDAVTYELPGGIIEKGEEPQQAALREMEEETGYTSADISFLMKLSPNPAINNNTAYFYLVRNAEPNGKQQFDAFEDLDVVSFSKEEVLSLLRENKIQHGVQVGAVYQALLKLGWLTEQ
ncbi:NUDIX hydrolase [Sediminibacterium ginsengisoli]|uniref:ADP-ribose pyrophosphatase YjhB, NUDIX family n=1 Tax=Sediminibacterium ginsengisoli TaxID=413434 RepID=A0A1T4P4B2_9BACT|nr:NUDIX hydrolase [Sediminibacterium ginsengisoli]SJZ86353.1 ADP-ribose pyrophosphatase YjhB, NUDIX family [Sediminibacterium ginsengisoli]